MGCEDLWWWQRLTRIDSSLSYKGYRNVLGYYCIILTVSASFISTSHLDPKIAGLEGWLSSEERCLLFQRTWVQFSATTWWLTTICNDIWGPNEEETWSAALINLDYEAQYGQVQQSCLKRAAHACFSMPPHTNNWKRITHVWVACCQFSCSHLPVGNIQL